MADSQFFLTMAILASITAIAGYKWNWRNRRWLAIFFALFPLFLGAVFSALTFAVPYGHPLNSVTGPHQVTVLEFVAIMSLAISPFWITGFLTGLAAREVLTRRAQR